MPKIVAVDVLQVDLAPMVPRSDAIQSFVTQETPMVRITTDDGVVGTGYSYTIGTGGSSVVALLADHLAPRLIGREADEIEAIWKDLFFATHATAVGAITALALAAIDTALWDSRGQRSGLPLWRLAGHQMVVVPSAMSGETNRLLGLAKELAPAGSSAESQRELDAIGGYDETLKAVEDFDLFARLSHRNMCCG